MMSTAIIIGTMALILAVGNRLIWKENNKKWKKKAYKKPKKAKAGTTPLTSYWEKTHQETAPKHESQETIVWTKPFLKSLEWKRYEEVCMEYLRIRNCEANVTCTGADGGIDIKISDKNGVIFSIAQCKAWNKPIGVNLIRELYGVMAAEKIKLGIFLTTSEYSMDALEFAKGKNLLLIDSDELIKLINNLDDANKKRINLIATEGDYTTPTCPNCDIKMIKRTTKNGNNAGKQFWGCSNFPKCKNTLQIRKELT